MPTPETGKERAGRVPLDYYKRPDRLERWKLGLGGAALAVVVVWLAGGLLARDGGRLRWSRGPVADVHATWDATCEACHVPFTPMQGDTWITHRLGIGSVSDDRCRTCH